MTLAAAQVIDVVAARLVPMSATGGRVYTSRTWPLAETDLPAWRIYATDEEVAPAAFGGANQHVLAVRAVAVTRQVDDMDEQLNALAEAGLALLFVKPAPYGLQLDRMTRRMSAEGEAAVGQIDITMSARYFVDPSQPETLLSS